MPGPKQPEGKGVVFAFVNTCPRNFETQPARMARRQE